MASPLFVPSPPPSTDVEPDRSRWSKDDRVRRAGAREALAHVLCELENGRLPVAGRTASGALDLRSPTCTVHIKPRQTPNGPAALIIAYPDWSPARPTTGADTYQISLPVRLWNMTDESPVRTLRACSALVRSALGHLDMVALPDGALHGACYEWLKVHLARLHLGGMLPRWATASAELTIGAGYRRFPAYVAMEDWIGDHVLFVDPLGRPIAPDIRNARAFRSKSLSVTAAPGRVHEVDFVHITAKTRIDELPDDPIELAKLVRTPGIPALISGGLATKGWRI